MIEKTVSIGGRSFRIAIEDGQEDALRQAVARLDEYGSDIARSSPQIDSQYLLLMSGIMLASSLDDSEADTRKTDGRIRDLENELTLLRASKRDAETKLADSKKQIADLEAEAKELAEAAVKAENRAKRIATLESEIINLEEQIAKSNPKNDDKLQEALGEANAKIQSLEAELERESSGRTALVEAIERLEGYLASKNQ